MKVFHAAILATSCILSISNLAEAQDGKFSGVQLTATGFGGTLEDAQIKAWAEPFGQATGATVNMTNPVSYAKIKAQVEANNVIEDMAHADAFFIQANCGTLFEKIDTAELIKIGVNQELITNDCGLPIAAGSLLFAYNTDAFPTAPSGWADFFDVDKYPGKRAVWNFVQNGLLEAALLADGVPADQLYPLDLDRAFRKIDTIKDQLNWVQSTGALTEALVNGDANLALSFSGRAYQAAKQGAPVDHVKDQQIVYWDNFGIIKGTKNLDAAKAFIAFIAAPETQARFTELSAYGSTNLSAKPQVDKLAASYLPFNEATQPSQVLLSQAWWAENFDTVNQRFVDWQSK